MNPRRSRTPTSLAPLRIAAPAAQRIKLPEFMIEPLMGRESMEQVNTDMMLVTMLSGQSVPSSLHAQTPQVADLIKRTIRSARFKGRPDEKLIIETQLPNLAGQPKRLVLLAGLGQPQRFCAQTAYRVFGLLLDQAIELGVKRITVPFVANRATGNCMNLKSMAHKMKMATYSRFSQLETQPNLSEIQIFCSAQAQQHIRKGLSIRVDFKSHDNDAAAGACSS